MPASSSKTKTDASTVTQNVSDQADANNQRGRGSLVDEGASLIDLRGEGADTYSPTYHITNTTQVTGFNEEDITKLFESITRNQAGDVITPTGLGAPPPPPGAERRRPQDYTRPALIGGGLLILVLGLVLFFIRRK